VLAVRPVLAGGAALPRYAAVACGSGDAPPRQLYRTDRRRSITGCPAARPRLRCGTLLLGSHGHGLIIRTTVWNDDVNDR